MFRKLRHKQTTWGGIRAVLYALKHKAESQRLAVVVDSEYVYAVTKNLLRLGGNFGERHRGLFHTVISGFIY